MAFFDVKKINKYLSSVFINNLIFNYIIQSYGKFNNRNGKKW